MSQGENTSNAEADQDFRARSSNGTRIGGGKGSRRLSGTLSKIVGECVRIIRVMCCY